VDDRARQQLAGQQLALTGFRRSTGVFGMRKVVCDVRDNNWRDNNWR
jgi:hypothetical protein